MADNEPMPEKTEEEQLAQLDTDLGAKRAFPGPSPKSSTNMLIVDVLLRGMARLARRKAEEQLLRRQIDPVAAKRVINGRTMGRSLFTYAATRVATRSVPGFLAVAGGLAAKTIVERKLAQRRADRVAQPAPGRQGAAKQAGDQVPPPT